MTGALRTLLAAFSLAIGMVAAPGMARANLLDKIAPYLPVSADTIAMARFSIDHPVQAGEIFTHAAEQDYPYFAIIGGIKVARKNGLTQSQCMLPITVVDMAFDKAEGTVSGAAAKTQTNAVVKSAESYAGQYAKATSDAARKKIKDEMAENIPYLKDLETMCSFAFNTDFKTFDDYYETAGNAASNLLRVYHDLKDGEYADAVADMLTMGMTGSNACKLIDDAVSGGVISRTPVLGKLVNGACAGFVGAVLDGVKHIVKGGIGLAKAAVAAAEDAGEGVADGFQGMGCDVFGVGCGHQVSWPEFVKTVGASYCPKHGWGAMADYSIGTLAPGKSGFPPAAFTCTNDETCRLPPFPQIECVSPEQKAAVAAFFRHLSDQQFTEQLNQWTSLFDKKYAPACLDQQCRGAVGIQRMFGINGAKQQHAANPDTSFSKVASTTLDPAEKSARRIVTDADFRVGAAKWAATFDGRYPDQCESDQQCRTALRFVRTGTLLKLQQIHEGNPDTLYFWATIGVYTAARKEADQIVEDVKPRLQQSDLKATEAASAGMAELAIGVWSKRCVDAPCVDEVKILAGKMRAFQNLTQVGQPNLSPLEVQKITNKEFEPRFQAAIDASKARVAAQQKMQGSATPKSPPPLAQPSPALRRFPVTPH